jgi:alkylation response protein AidB-like acyl-CoA dehydrogenase
MTTTQSDATGVQAEALQRLLDGRHADLRRRIRDVLGEDEFAPPIAIGAAEYRERVRGWMQRITDEGLTAPGFPAEFGGQEDPGANIAGFETIAFGDLSLLLEFGVQFGLRGGAIQQPGTRIHHERHLKPTAALKLIGCFAMTETGHVFNVQQLGTTATYDPDTDDLVVSTPTDEVHKDYVGKRDLARPSGGCAVACRAPSDRARPALSPGARPAHRTSLRGGHARGQPAVPAAPRQRRCACRRVGIPDQVLRAPIGLRDPAAASAA